MNFSKLTILTGPENNSKYSGPQAVRSSLVEGLKKINVNFNCNPGALSEVGEVVVVLSDIEALKQAISWKCTGQIKKLLVGPNLAGVPFEISSLPLSNQIDVCLNPCQWSVDWWKSVDPDFCLPLYIWPAGVDTEFWQPQAPKPVTNNVLIYKKTYPEDLFQSCISIVNNKGLTISIIEYGHYSPEEYKTKLNQADFAVFLSESESQGIALFESWSCNVPTLVWDRGFFEWLGYSGKASSAPYLSDLTGISFSGAGEFEISLNQTLENLKNFQPRLWILNNGSNEVSALRLINIINGLEEI